MKNFKPYLEELLKHEGGYVNHPEDPGGMTNLGVTKKVWDKWIGEESTEKEMRALTPQDVEPLYKKRYWNAVKAEELPVGLDLCVFDFGVNAGTRRATRYLQKILGVTQDGIIGKNTLKALHTFIEKEGLKNVIALYQLERTVYYKKLKHFATFGKGWLKRVNQVTEKALKISASWE